ncbi:MAG: sugar ABC transporter permease [Lachnospiraceae bacterium]
MKETTSKANVVVKKKISTRKMHDWFAAYVFIAPLVIGLGLFYVFPFVQNIWFSFNDVNKFNVATFAGLDNYKRLFTDPNLLNALWNTIKYVLITTPVGLGLSLLIAALLNTKIKGTSFYRTIYFLPAVTMPVAIALVWKFIFNGDYGLLNNFLKIFGIHGKSWLSDANTALYMVMIVAIWSSVGYNVIILLAGMQGISRTYYEAAAIDGAGPAVQFFKITIPMVSPTLFFVLITGLIGGFQVFDSIYMLVGVDNPIFEKVQTLNIMFYRNGFQYGYKGYAAAISVFMFALIMIVTVVQLIGQKKWVNYE